MRYDGIDCRYYQINNRISKQGKNVSNLRYSPSSLYFFARCTLSIFHYNYDRIPTHFGTNQRLGNGTRSSIVRNNCRAETPLLFGNFYYIPFKLPVGM